MDPLSYRFYKIKNKYYSEKRNKTTRSESVLKFVIDGLRFKTKIKNLKSFPIYQIILTGKKRHAKN